MLLSPLIFLFIKSLKVNFYEDKLDICINEFTLVRFKNKTYAYIISYIINLISKQNNKKKTKKNKKSKMKKYICIYYKNRDNYLINYLYILSLNKINYKDFIFEYKPSKVNLISISLYKGNKYAK